MLAQRLVDLSDDIAGLSIKDDLVVLRRRAG